jgi:hypothetical protein
MTRFPHRLLPAFAIVAALASASCTEDVGTSVRISLVYKDGWKMASADVVTSRADGTLEKNAPIAHQILVLLPDDLAGEVMPLDVWGVRDGERISHGSAVALPRKGDTVEATIVLDRLPCGAFCKPGDLQCDGNSVSTCGADADGCLEWGETTECAEATPNCSGGVCGVQCSDECIGAVGECVDETHERKCGLIDLDPCRDLAAQSPCPGSQVCFSGRCGMPCTLETALTNSPIADVGLTPFAPVIAIDSVGTSHAVYSVVMNRQLRYAYRLKGGAWTAWQNIPAGIGENPSLVADKQGGLHLSFGGTALTYGYRPAGAASAWQLTPVQTGRAVATSSVALDDVGVAHIVYHLPATTVPPASDLMRHARQGTPWVLEDIDTLVGYGCDLVIVGKTLHVSSLSNGNNVWYSVLEPGTAWSTTMIQDLEATAPLATASTSIVADRGGTLHLVYSDLFPGNDDLRYLYKAGASWTTTPVIIDRGGGSTGAYAELAVDPFDRLHVAYRTTAATPSLRYAYKDTGAASLWVISRQPPTTSGFQPSIAVAPDGDVHILSGAGSVIETSRACTGSTLTR